MKMDFKVIITKLIFVFPIFLYGHIKAQDKIIKIDNTLVEGKVIKVDMNSIEMDPSGTIPFIIIPRKDVKMIIYSDNTIIDFEYSDKDVKDNKNLNTKLNVSKQSNLTNFAAIDIVKNYKSRDYYKIDETIPFRDTLNNQEFVIILRGSFSVIGNEEFFVKIKDLKLKIELSKGGIRNSEDVVFNPSYTIEQNYQFSKNSD
ncbi:MAG: hypothetical protein GYA41_06255 [Bacteroidales bacterium]|nr:hypothetical protein [Bacteroidales bacterium]